MKRLPKKQLKELFETIVAESGGKCGEANPFIYQRGNFKCYVFIKNISPAYYVNYPDNSRVQLPTSNRFKEVINSDLDFLILGYDNDNDVFAAWDPSLIKNRLNEKRNVSVYSRFSWQRIIPAGEFVERHLGNQEKVILFKKELLNDFFERYRALFDLTENNIQAHHSIGKEEFGFDIKTVRSIIDPLLKEHKVLQAVSALENVLKNDLEYSELSFKDYFKIVEEIYTDDLLSVQSSDLIVDTDNDKIFRGQFDQIESRSVMDNVLLYFNLFRSGIYILTDKEPLKADYVIPIQEFCRTGFLLQCYKSGHVNKVKIATLLSKKIGKEYMNGLNKDGELVHVEAVETEKIFGINFTENGRRKFKAHLTENISMREQLHLQGIKVMYNEFERIEYTVLSLDIFKNIRRLVFQSFTANGKSLDNNYYAAEWRIIRKLVNATQK